MSANRLRKAVLDRRRELTPGTPEKYPGTRVSVHLLDLEEALHQTQKLAEEIKRLASDPFTSKAIALRACLLAANEALGLPGPEPSPERDIARAVIEEIGTPCLECIALGCATNGEPCSCECRHKAAE